MRKIRNLIYKIKVKLGLISPAGFTKLYYRGLPVIQRDDMPNGTVGFINENTARVRLMNWKTGKVNKLMTFKEFYAWIAREYKRLNKYERI